MSTLRTWVFISAAVFTVACSSDSAELVKPASTTLPVPTGVAISGTPRHGQLLTAAAKLPAKAPAGAALAFTWLVDGKPKGTAKSLAGDQFAKGDHVVLEARLAVAGKLSDPATSPTVTIDNTPPVTEKVTFAAGPYRTDSTLQVTATGSDADGDTVTLTYVWKVNGTPIAGIDAATLDGTHFSKNDRVTVTVTPNDGEADGTALVSSTVTIDDTAPSITGATLASGPFTVGTDIGVASISGASDADGDSLTYSYQWYVDGTPIAGQSAAVLPAGFATKGAVVAAQVIPNDGTADGLPVFSNAVTIQNAPPVITSLTLGGPYKVTDIVSVSSTSADADADAVVLHYQWYVAGATAGTDSAALAGAFAKHQEVWVVAQPYDGTAYGAAVSAPAITIQNSAPALMSVNLAAGPFTTASTIAIAAENGWSDADGDTAGYTFAWYVNGTVVAGQTGSSLSGAFFNKGNTVRALVTPYDGETSGSPVYSAAVTIQNTPPKISSVTLTSAGARFSVSYAINASLTAGDADGDALAYSYVWRVDGNVVAGQTASALPAGQATRGQIVTVTVTGFDGTDYSNTIASAAATVANALPPAPTVTLAPAMVTEGSALIYATAGGTVATDADGDSVTYAWAWTKNGAAFAAGVTSVNGPFAGGDVWAALLTASDGYENAPTGTATTSIYNKAVTVATGDANSCWVTNHSAVYCSGVNYSGIVGVAADSQNYYTPHIVNGFPAAVSSIAVGNNHACALLVDGRVYCWGGNDRYQLSQSLSIWSTPTPQYVSSLSGVVQVTAGDSFSCARKNDGSVWCWGRDDDGQLGNNSFDMATQAPQQVQNLTAASHISSGGDHSCAVESGAVKCWGYNYNCVLAKDWNGGTYLIDSASLVTGLSGVTVVDTAVDRQVSCFRTDTGAVYCVGSYSNVGFSSTNACVQTPGLVTKFPSGAVSIAVGTYHSCGLKSDGTVDCWGPYSETVANSGFTSLSGADAMCGITAAGGSNCLFFNDYGQHGAPGGYTTTPRASIGFGGY